MSVAAVEIPYPAPSGPIRVSVVVPTYRRPTFLRRAIASVMDQTVTSWELIVVDDNDPADAGRRETEAMMAEYATDGRIVYVRHDRNRGGGAARNTGVRTARAPFVAFLDDDDTWHPDKLERQLDRIEQGPDEVALVYCRVRVVRTGPGVETMYATDGRSHGVRDLLIRNSIGTTSCILCRVGALLDVGLFDETLPARQDQDLYIRLARRYDIAFVDAVLVTLHVHEEPRISTNAGGSVRAHEVFYAKYRELIEADPEVLHAMRYQHGKHLVAAALYREARSVLGQAWRARPTDLEVLTRLAMTFAAPRALVGPTKRALRAWRGLRRGGGR